MFVRSYEELVGSDVNTVINSAITSVHYEINKKCIEEGKNLFAEKPSATEVG